VAGSSVAAVNDVLHGQVGGRPDIAADDVDAIRERARGPHRPAAAAVLQVENVTAWHLLRLNLHDRVFKLGSTGEQTWHALHHRQRTECWPG